jgi:hypothetical protein
MDELGYIPSGLHRDVDFSYRGRDFCAEARPDRDNLWRAEVTEWNPDLDREIHGIPCRMGRNRLASDELYGTPAEAVAAAVEFVVATLDSGGKVIEIWTGDEEGG